jgi:hypothetical protein
MKRNDIVTIFGDPLGLKNPVGQARLVDPILKSSSFEVWSVEFLDQEGLLFTKLIRNLDCTKSELIEEYERTKEERD